MEETVSKEKYQEKIANVICNKPIDITCEECYLLGKGSICKSFSSCRISEKTVEQMEYAVMPIDECVFLNACAGSGKTEVVGLKTAYEMKRWNLYNQGIAVLTFTNDATNVIIERVKQFTGKRNTYPHYIGTLSSFVHSYIVQPFAYKLRGFKGKNGDFSFRVIDNKMPIYSNHWLKKYSCKVSYIDSQEHWKDLFAHQIGYDMWKGDFYFPIGKNQVKWLVNYYESEALQKFIEKKREVNQNFWKFDHVKKCFWDCKMAFWRDGFATFDDLNYLAVEVLSRKSMGSKISERFPIIFIDECQDLSGNELKILKSLQRWGCIIHCIGDLNQSIYEFKRVEPDEVKDYVKDFRQKQLSINFRSCKEIVDFSEKLIGRTDSESANVKSQFGDKALLYIEYKNPQDAIDVYTRLLNKYNFGDKENRILVRQNALRLQLERSSHKDYDEDEPLIVAVQLWKKELPQQMKLSLELAGKQISRWFGGEQTKANYYCPKEITSVYQWRLFLMNVLKGILQSDKLSDFSLTYGKWHGYAKKELGKILEKNYMFIEAYDEAGSRNFTDLIDGKNFRVSTGNGKVVIGELVENAINSIPIMTIHGSKGCTFDTTLVVSKEDAYSKGGHWKTHWLNGEGETKRIGYVASTRARHLLVWGVPKLTKEDINLLESYGFNDAEKLLKEDGLSE